MFASNGIGYACPGSSTYVMTIDPSDDSVNATAIDVSAYGTNLNWYGGAFSDGYAICVPYHLKNIALIIDTSDNSFSTTTFSTSCSSACYRGAAAANGKVYGTPYRASELLIIDAATGTADTSIDVSAYAPGVTYKWIGAEVAADGRIFMAPWNSNNVLVVDPDTNAISTIATPAFEKAFADLVAAPNGLLFGVPSCATYVLIVDPSDDSVDTTSITGLSSSTFKWLGGAAASDGLVYMVPSSASTVLAVDPTTLQVMQASSPAKYCDYASTSDNGAVYSTTGYSSAFLVIEPTCA